MRLSIDSSQMFSRPVDDTFGRFIYLVRLASRSVTPVGIFLPTSDTFEHHVARLCGYSTLPEHSLRSKQVHSWLTYTVFFNSRVS